MLNRFSATRMLAVTCAIFMGRGAFAAPPLSQAVSDNGDLASKLAKIEKTIDKQRESLHVPGASLVIVKDDKVIYVKGFGLRDVEHKLPVTPATQFAIGSSTKAFTAMTAMMSVDDGKLSLSDSPKKYVPYFKLQDPEADSKITIGDLLCHRSGLDRTDIAWYTGKLNSEETIRLVSNVKPTAKLGEKFQYQNVMFLVAGQCVGAAQHAPWRTVVAKRIFEPLHMKQTNTSIHDLERAKEHALGYTYDAVKKATVLLPYRDLPAVAPAGAINSNANEMAQWLRLMLGGGVFEGKRLVSEASFAELFKKRINVGVRVDYGYGWFLRDWNGHRVVEHGGNIDGFNAQVALMPDQNLGLVLLTNVSASPLGTIAMETVWDGLVDVPKSADDNAASASGPKVDPASEAGTYRLAEANANIIVAFKNGKLVARSARLPESALENLSGRRYKVVIPGLDGVFATFRPAKEDPKQTEMLFEQPGAKFVCKRVPDVAPEPATAFAAPMPVEELMRKVVEAQGGEANLRRHKTLTLKSTGIVESQGLTLRSVEYSRVPNANANMLSLYVGRKQIGTIRGYFDGKDGGSESSITPSETATGDALADLAVNSTLFPELNWRTLFKTVNITGKEKIGDEEVYIVEMKPEKGNPLTDYVSAKTFRVLRRKVQPGSQVESYSDFRTVDGVLIPFVRTGVMPGFGETVTTITEAKFDTRIPDSVFRATAADDGTTR